MAFVVAFAYMPFGAQMVYAAQVDPDDAVVELHKSDTGGTRYFDSVQEAFGAGEVKTGDTIKLLKDVALTEPVTTEEVGNADFTFDLNGHTLGGDGIDCVLYIKAGESYYDPTVTLISSSAGGTIRTESASPAVIVEQGTLIMDGNASIEAVADGVSVSGGTLQMKGGSIDSTNGPAIVSDDAGSVIDIRGGWTQVYEDPDEPDYRTALRVDEAASLSMTGGRVDGMITGDAASGFITGGTFRPAPDDGCIADGYVCIPDPDINGLYKVVKNENTVRFTPDTMTYEPFSDIHKQRVEAKLFGPNGQELTPSGCRWYKYDDDALEWVDLEETDANTYLADAGDYKAVLTYNDSVSEGEFTISPFDIDGCNVQGTTRPFTGFEYDLSEGLKVQKTSQGALQDLTYDVISVSGNLNAGTCRFTIEGTGNYTGQMSDSFIIMPAQFDDVEFSLTTDEVTWKDDAWEPEVTGTYTTDKGEYTLDPSEYEVEYSDNTDVGEATVTITNSGSNFEGDTPKVLHFNIVSAAAKVVSGDDASYFHTAAAAFAAADDGDSVVLLADCDEAESITVDKDITIDLGEYDLGSEDNSFDIEAAQGATVELTGSGKIYGQVTNRGSLTIKGGEIMYGEGDDTLYGFENHGDAEISGGIIRGGIKTYSGVLPITGGTIFGELAQDSPATFAISGGFFENPVDPEQCAENYLPMDAPEGSPAPYTVGLSYQVSFDLQGHDGTAPDPQRVITGNKATKPELVVSEATGEAVGKWYKDAECTEEWDFDTDVVTEDTILYADWQHYHDGVLFADWTETDSMPTESGNYVLKNDVTLQDIWEIGSSKDIKICLDGHTVTKDNTSGNNGVISIYNASLSIYDPENTGKITGGMNEQESVGDYTPAGGGISVLSRGVLNMYGGQITGNTGTNGGGVYVLGTFNMYDGIISDNTGDKGGGVRVLKRYSGNASTFNMYGGEIKNNTSDWYGGGVDLSTGTFNLMGGTITGNSTKNSGAGIFAGYDSSTPVFNIGSSEKSAGPIIVKDNNGGNIYLDYRIDGYDQSDRGGTTVMNVVSPLDEDSILAFDIDDGGILNRTGAKVEVTNGLTEEKGSLDNFVYDREYNKVSNPKKIYLDEETGEVILMKAFAVEYDPGEGSGSVDPVIVKSGGKTYLIDNPFEAPEVKEEDAPGEMIFTGWKVGSSDDIVQPGTELTPTASTTVTAQYGLAVAEVEETGQKFTTINEAKDATQEGQTLKLLHDVDVSDQYYLGVTRSITLDLNGHTLSSDKYVTMIIGRGDVTIKDSSDDGSGKIVNTSTSTAAATFPTAVRVDGEAALTLENGVLHSYYGGITLSRGTRIDGSKYGAKVYINGGIVDAGKESIRNGDDGTYGTVVEINGGGFSDDIGNGELFTRPEGQKLIKDDTDGYYRLAEPATVSFEAGGGDSDVISGEMADVEVGKGLKYKLPQCRFINEMHSFDGWIVDGTEYAAGDLITVDGDTTVTAKWAADSINLFIRGIQVTGDNYRDVLGDGTVRVENPQDPDDPKYRTVTIILDNATIETSKREDGMENDMEFGIRYNVPDTKAEIVLKGENKIVNGTTDEGTVIEQGMAIYQAQQLTFTGDGTLSVEMEAEREDMGYIGISSRQKTVIDGIKLDIDIPGIGASRGYHQEYTNVLSVENGGELYINTGSSDMAYSIYTQRAGNKLVSVSEDSKMELVSGNMAVNEMTQVTDDTRSLGALVNADAASDDGARVWDGETALSTYKYILIPYSVDKTSLEEAIRSAKEAENGVKTSKDGKDVDTKDKWTTAAQKKALDDAITKAQAVLDDKGASQKDIDAAVNAVKQAASDYNKAKKAGLKPGRPTIRTIEGYKKKKMKVTWKKVSGATGYKVAYRLAGSKKWTVKNVTGTSVTLKGMKNRGLYQYKVAAVRKASGKTVQGNYSAVKYRYMMAKSPKLTAGKKKIKVTWKPDKKASGYTIRYSTKKSMKGAKTITVKGGKKKSCTIKKLKKGKRYYVKITPYKNKGGHKYIGEYKIKSKKAK